MEQELNDVEKEGTEQGGNILSQLLASTWQGAGWGLGGGRGREKGIGQHHKKPEKVT